MIKSVLRVRLEDAYFCHNGLSPMVNLDVDHCVAITRWARRTSCYDSSATRLAPNVVKGN